MAILQAARNSGLGKHIGTLSDEQIGYTGHLVVTVQSFSVLTSFFGRVSFAFFLLSVVGDAKVAARNTLYGLVVVQILVNALVVVQVYTQCGAKMSALWNPEVAKTAHCSAADVETYIGYVQASINSLCDLVLTILPITIVWNLRMPSGTKVALAGLLCLSSFAFVASIAKAVEIRLLSSGPDFTYHFALLQYFVVVECDVVMIAASMPMLRPLWRKIDAGPNAPSYDHSSRAQTGGTKLRTMPDGTRISDDEEHMLSVLPERGIQRTMETDVRTESLEKERVDVSVKSLDWK